MCKAPVKRRGSVPDDFMGQLAMSMTETCALLRGGSPLQLARPLPDGRRLPIFHLNAKLGCRTCVLKAASGGGVIAENDQSMHRQQILDLIGNIQRKRRKATAGGALWASVHPEDLGAP